MVRNQLTPKCNRSNRCSFTKTRPEAGFPSVINIPILCQYGVMSSGNFFGEPSEGLTLKFGFRPLTKF